MLETIYSYVLKIYNIYKKLKIFRHQSDWLIPSICTVKEIRSGRNTENGNQSSKLLFFNNYFISKDSCEVY